MLCQIKMMKKPVICYYLSLQLLPIIFLIKYLCRITFFITIKTEHKLPCLERMWKL